MSVTLLGPQRRPTLDQVVAPLRLDGPVATITAGWQEREPDDEELDALLDGRSLNLRLYGRWLDIQERDPEFAQAELEQRTYLEELRTLYLVQLQSAATTINVLAQRNGDRPEAISDALDDARAVVRLIDDTYLTRVRRSTDEFLDRHRPKERPVVAEHQDAVHQALQESSGLVVPGGHVAVLLRLMRLFDVAHSIPDTVIAWSAGAMALTERVVLFHDKTPQGVSPSEIYDDGLGVIRGLVLLPHARRRLQVDNPVRMSTLSRRFAPAMCVVLDDGVQVDLGADGALPATARIVGLDGRIVPLADA